MLSELEFGSHGSYVPRTRATTAAQQDSATWTYNLKGDVMIRGVGSEIFPRPLTTSSIFAQRVRENYERSPLHGVLGPTVVLVPVPRSSLTKAGTLWPAERIAMALCQVGLGGSVHALLRRTEPVAPSSLGGARLAKIHYESMGIANRVSRDLFTTRMRIVLVDDVVTSGATLLGAASRMAEALGDSEIRGFAAVRTISDPSAFRSLRDPVLGRITLREDGTCRRVP